MINVDLLHIVNRANDIIKSEKTIQLVLGQLINEWVLSGAICLSHVSFLKMQCKSNGQPLLLVKWKYICPDSATWWWSVLLCQMVSEVCLSRASSESMEQRPYYVSLPSALHFRGFVSYPVSLCTAARSHLLCCFAICLRYWQALSFFPTSGFTSQSEDVWASHFMAFSTLTATEVLLWSCLYYWLRSRIYSWQRVWSSWLFDSVIPADK